MNRWVLPVAAYAGLMTDRYPPFRLDMGGHEPGTLILPLAEQEPLVGRERPPGAGGPVQPGGWTGPRIVSVVAGAVLTLLSLGLLGGGGAALWAHTQRQGGYVNFGTTSYSAPGYALTSDALEMHATRGGWDAASLLVGTVRIRVTQAAGHPVFIGIAPAVAAERYLTGVGYVTVSGTADHHGTYTEHGGSAPAVPPTAAGIWTVQASGPGTQTLTWAVQSGDWMVVTMNADGSQPVNIQVDVAATLPALPWVAAGLLAAGFACLAGGILLIAIPLRNVS
jgi:hypothetical protein